MKTDQATTCRMSLDERWLDGAEIDRRIQMAIRKAVLDHKRADHPVAVWRDGGVVIVPPEEIVVPDEE